MYLCNECLQEIKADEALVSFKGLKFHGPCIVLHLAKQVPNNKEKK